MCDAGDGPANRDDDKSSMIIGAWQAVARYGDGSVPTRGFVGSGARRNRLFGDGTNAAEHRRIVDKPLVDDTHQFGEHIAA